MPWPKATGKTRHCPRCDQHRDERYFIPNKRRSTGFNAYCRFCHAQVCAEAYRAKKAAKEAGENRDTA